MKRIIVAVLMAVGVLGGVALSATPAQAYSPCQGYCVNIQNMDWALNHNVQVGICDNCGAIGQNGIWTWLLNVNQQTPSVTPDVDGYYIGSGWCAKEFRSYGNNVWSERSTPITGPAKVTTWDYSWYRVYAYQAQPPWGCNF